MRVCKYSKNKDWHCNCAKDVSQTNLFQKYCPYLSLIVLFQFWCQNSLLYMLNMCSIPTTSYNWFTISILRNHSFSTQARFFEKLTFLPLIRTNVFFFSVNFAYVLNKWSPGSNPDHVLSEVSWERASSKSK